MNTEKILVLGSGAMGEGIAQTFAQYGFDVRLVARREEPLTRALEQIRQNVQQIIEFDLIQETVEEVVGRIEGLVTTDMVQAVEGCTYVVETVREVLEDKRALLAAVQAANENLLIGSNTGSFTVDSLAEGMPCPENIIGGLREEDRPRAQRGARFHREPHHGGDRTRDRLPPGRRHRHPRGLGYRD
jgi:3-hydroxyacyl-CoA dehydrogenase